ncbi:hypothetical protein KIN20_031016 [Parelaphostrongylus tenuis]|uniref:Uncharacterized protein n=1 Tax=Parelaphostrongylus tenuis TaxID=148309 RepID=A0AAD5WGQ5_PARTN|nr:hypothetical protein KIN20_031016 [Parelaphostrongylus tenuis]
MYSAGSRCKTWEYMDLFNRTVFNHSLISFLNRRLKVLRMADTNVEMWPYRSVTTFCFTGISFTVDSFGPESGRFFGSEPSQVDYEWMYITSGAINGRSEFGIGCRRYLFGNRPKSWIDSP